MCNATDFSLHGSSICPVEKVAYTRCIYKVGIYKVEKVAYTSLPTACGLVLCAKVRACCGSKLSLGIFFLERIGNDMNILANRPISINDLS